MAAGKTMPASEAAALLQQACAEWGRRYIAAARPLIEALAAVPAVDLIGALAAVPAVDEARHRPGDPEW